MISENFLRSGKAIFTVSNGKGEHYTYRVKRKEDREDATKFVYFVQLLTGPNNMKDYTYVGLLASDRLEFIITKGSQTTRQSLSVKVFCWMLRILGGYTTLPEGYKIQNEGRCGRCSKRLTDPLSIETGIGPECRKIMGI